MKNKEFDQLLFDANGHLDMLQKMVKETIEAEDDLIHNALNPILEVSSQRNTSFPEMCE